jgi:hypothetical protein
MVGIDDQQYDSSNPEDYQKKQLTVQSGLLTPMPHDVYQNIPLSTGGASFKLTERTNDRNIVYGDSFGFVSV